MLIGSIGIGMSVNQGGLTKGLAKSSKIVQGWSVKAAKDISSGRTQVSKSLTQLGDAASSIGLLLQDSLRSFNPLLGVGKAWASYLIPELTDPIRSSFAFVLAGVGGWLGGKLTPITGALTNAVKATGSALSDVFGPALAKIGTAVGKSNLGPLAIQFGRLTQASGGLVGGLLKVGVGVGKLGVGLAKMAWSAAVSGAKLLGSAMLAAGRSIVSVGVGLAKLGAAGLVVGGILGVKAAGAAAHLTETFNKTEQVFGKSGEGVVATAEKMNTAFGVSRKEFLDGAAGLGGLLQGFGYAEKDSAALATSLTRLAADSSAFRDVPLPDAVNKIRSAMSGSGEVLTEWGIILNDDTVKAKAFAMGIYSGTGAVSQSAKAQARLSIITQGLSKDQGALTRESTGTAAQMAEFWGRIQTLWEQIGTSLAPLLGVALQGINQAIVAAGLAWEDGQQAVLGWFGVTNTSLGEASGGVGILQTSIGFLADSWSVVKGATALFFSYMESGIAKIASGLSVLFSGLEKIGAGEWATSARKALEDYSASAQTVSTDLAKTSQDAFGSTGKGSAAVNDYFARAAKKIEDAKASLATTGGVDTSKKPAEAAAAPTKDEKNQRAGAYGFGSKDAANVVLSSRAGSKEKAADKAAKATADNTAKIATATVDMGKAFTDWAAKSVASAITPVLVSL